MNNIIIAILLLIFLIATWLFVYIKIFTRKIKSLEKHCADIWKQIDVINNRNTVKQ